MKKTKLILALAIISFLVQYSHSACTFTWVSQISGVTNNLHSVSAVDENICWVAGVNGKVMRTTNAGINWLNASAPFVFADDIYNICALDENTALAAAFNFTAAVIWRTTNGGGSWTFVLVQPGGFINSIIMKDANTGFAYGDPVGGRWSLWKTTNGGANWDSTGLYLPQAGTELGWKNSMSIVGDTIWFGTSNSRIYRSTNFGATGSWTACLNVKNVNTYGVCFINANIGVCVGTVVARTTDGGITWHKKGQPGGSGNITSVGGRRGGKNLWLTRGSTIYGSNNRGKNWNGTGYTASNSLLAINIANISGCANGWCSGQAGTLIRLTGIGSTKPDEFTDDDIANEIPDAYNLDQNYPNPFNPVTKIKFSIPQSGFVRLSVYDVLGNEVAILLNESLSPGTYEADFNASELSSGVYFYKLEAEGFTDVKKMVLVK